jgi:hypothetical protein
VSLSETVLDKLESAHNLMSNCWEIDLYRSLNQKYERRYPVEHFIGLARLHWPALIEAARGEIRWKDEARRLRIALERFNPLTERTAEDYEERVKALKGSEL